MNPRLIRNNFNALRTGLALTVVLFHLGLLSEAPALAPLALLPAHFAVQCFFFISGFLVTMSREKSTLGSYFAKRARRVLPGYWTAVLGAALALAPLSTFGTRYLTHAGLWRYLGANLAFANWLAPTLPGLFVGHPAGPAVNGALWTIKIEVAFYLTLPALLWLTWLWRLRTVLAFAIGLSLGWSVGCAWLAELPHGARWHTLGQQLPGQLSFFLLGAWAYLRVKEGRTLPGAPWAGLAVLVYAGSGGVLHQLLAPFCVAAIVSWLAVGATPVRFDVNRFGDLSYGLYVYHWPVIQAAVALGAFRANPFAAAALVLGAIGLLAWASWHCVERPWFARTETRAPRKLRALTILPPEVTKC